MTSTYAPNTVTPDINTIKGFNPPASTTLPSTAIGLRPHTVDRSYGLVVHEPIADPAILLADPSIPVYRDLDHAKKSLLRGTRSPAGTTRIFSLADIPYSTRVRLPYEIQRLDQALLVLDKPVIIDASHPEPIVDAIRKFGPLPCFSENVLDRLLTHPALAESSSSPVWGLPALQLQRLRADGKPYRKPGPTLRAKDDAYTQAHLGHLDAHFFRSTPISEIHSVLRDYPFFPIPYTTYFSNPTSQKENTRANRIRTAARNARSLTDTLNHLLKVKSTARDCHGPFRSPLIFLLRFHRPLLFSLLYAFYPYLHTMSDFPVTDPNARLSVSNQDLRICSKSWKSLRLALARLTFRMGLRSYPVPPPVNSPSKESLNDLAEPAPDPAPDR